MNRHLRIPLVACAVLALAGCAAIRPPAQSPTRAPAANPPTDDRLDALLWAQNAAEHDLVYLEIYRDAQSKLLRALHDRNWDALPREDRSGPARQLKPAIILDIDETVLDNSPYEARLIREHRAFDEAGWRKWCEEAAARPLPGALALTRFAAAHGIDVYYLSNRDRSLDAVTLKNLRDAGFPVTTANAFLGAGTPVPGCTQVHAADKTCRRRLIGRTHRVLMQFGDQLGDFVSLGDGSLAARGAAIGPYRNWIGERWFVLPNPMYGSWESALYGNDRALTPDQQRARKLEHLRVD